MRLALLPPNRPPTTHQRNRLHLQLCSLAGLPKQQTRLYQHNQLAVWCKERPVRPGCCLLAGWLNQRPDLNQQPSSCFMVTAPRNWRFRGEP